MNAEEQGPLPNLSQAGKVYRQKYWGMGLAVLGFLLEWMVIIGLELMVRNSVGQVAQGTMLALGLSIAVGMCASGIGYYSKAKGSSAAWGIVGVVPLLGLLLFLFLFPLLTDFRKNRLGFVLSMIVLGILAAILIPSYLNYNRAIIQANILKSARVDLHAIATYAIAYKTKHRTFEISDITQLGFISTGKPYYTLWYAVKGVPTKMNVVDPARARGCDGPPTIAQVAASATGFTALARGNMDGDSTCDEWSINDARVLTHTIDDFSN